MDHSCSFLLHKHYSDPCHTSKFYFCWIYQAVLWCFI